MILRHNANFQDLFFIFAELFMYRRTYALSLFQGAFLWLQTIDMDAFDNNVVESYKMSKSIFVATSAWRNIGRPEDSIPTNRKSRRSWRGNVPCSRSCHQILNTAFYGPFYAGITAAVSCFVFNRRHRTEDTADTLVSLVV